MAEKKTAGAGDTDFRRTWDKTEYAARAAVHESKLKEEGKARYEAKLAGKKYHRRASTPPDVRETEARSKRLDVGAMVGKTMLVPAGAAIGKRGKGAGFYCEVCDLTFKDNLQLVEHYNSPQHLRNSGESGEVRRAGVREVRERLRWLKRRRDEEEAEKLVGVDLEGRIERSRTKMETEEEERRRKRNEKRRRQKERRRGGESD